MHLQEPVSGDVLEKIDERMQYVLKLQAHHVDKVPYNEVKFFSLS